MEIKAHHRKVCCEVCKNPLASIYIRSNKKFKSLENYYFCEDCQKIYKIGEENEM